MTELEFETIEKGKGKRFIMELQEGFIKIAVEGGFVNQVTGQRIDSAAKHIMDFPEAKVTVFIDLVSEAIVAILADCGVTKSKANIIAEITAKAQAVYDVLHPEEE